MKKTIFSVAAATMILTSSASAFFGTEATEWTQLANNAQLVNQYKKQLEQYATQLQSMKSLTEKIGKLDPSQWNQFVKTFGQMKDIMEQTNGLNYQSAKYLDEFAKTHPGFEEYLKSKNLNLSDAYKSLSEQTRNTVKDNLKALNLSQKDFNDDEITLKKLSDQSSNAVGQLAAVQAASDIAVHQTHQIKKLQQLMQLQVQSANQYMATQQSKEDVARAAWQKTTSPEETIDVNSGKEAGGRRW